MKKRFVLALILVIALLVVSASASENTLISEMKGDNVLPYFALNGQVAFCLESEVEHPVDGTAYQSTGYYNNDIVKSVIAKYETMKSSVDTETLNSVMQQVLWDVIDGTQSHRNVVARRMGPVGIQMYDELMISETAFLDEYIITMTVYATEEGNYQRLMSWSVAPIPETTEFSVEKHWDDDNNRDGIRPENVEITLYANGVETQVVVLNSENNWSHTFTELPKYDENHVEISYEVSETIVPEGYVATVESTATGAVITNKHTPAMLTLTINKVWDDADNQDGIRPDEVTIYLFANDEAIAKFELNEENNWTTEYTTNQFANGDAVAFHIKEVAVEGYKAVYSAARGTLIVTNVHEPAPVVIPEEPDEPVIELPPPVVEPEVEPAPVEPVAPEVPAEPEVVPEEPVEPVVPDAPVLEWSEPVPEEPPVEPAPVEPVAPEVPVEPEAPVLEYTDPVVPDVPQTGDNSHLAIWFVTAALSGMALLVLMTSKKKTSK